MDPAQAIDIASQALAAIVSLVGLVVAVAQWTRPAVLKRRVKWLYESMEHEENEARLETLGVMVRRANASLVAGVLVPGWRFLPLAAYMLLGPAQAFIWARTPVIGISSAHSDFPLLSRQPPSAGACDYSQSDTALRTSITREPSLYGVLVLAYWIKWRAVLVPSSCSRSLERLASIPSQSGSRWHTSTSPVGTLLLASPEQRSPSLSPRSYTATRESGPIFMARGRKTKLTLTISEQPSSRAE